VPLIRPFRALHYALDRFPGLDPLVTQPFDRITDAMRREYRARHPRNFVRLIRERDRGGKPGAVRAAATLRRWLRDGTLAREARPALYPYDVTYAGPGRRRCTRTGVFAILGLAGPGVIRPHERTFEGPIRDRLALLRATGVNTEPILLLYRDEDRRVERLAAGAEPLLSTREGGALHVVRRLADPARIRAVQAALRGRPALIADGHHRFATAARFAAEKDARGAAGDAHRFLLVVLCNVVRNAITILPTHRVVRSEAGLDARALLGVLGPDFETVRVTGSRARLLEAVRAEGARGRIAFGLESRSPRGRWVLRHAREEKRPGGLLDVDVLHREVIARHLLRGEERPLENVDFLKDPEAAGAALRRGRWDFAFYLNPTRLNEVEDRAARGVPLPRKSTDFQPKLLSGLLLRELYSPPVS